MITLSKKFFNLIAITILTTSCSKNFLGDSKSLGGGNGAFQPGVPARDDDNLAPTASNISLSTAKNNAVSGTFSATDPESDTLNFEVVTSPIYGDVVIDDPAAGTFTYTPDNDFSGVDTFTYKATDAANESNVATVTVTVTNTVTAPIADDITPTAFNEDTESGVITLSYTDPENDLATSCSTSNLNKVTVSTACSCDGSGVCTLKVTGTANSNGSASFDYTVVAGGETSNTATASFTITAVNDAPTASAISFTTNEDTTYSSNGGTRPNLSGSDVDGDTLTCTKDTDPTNGTVTVNSNCTFSYTPDADYNGADSFTFYVNDGTTNSTSATATITVSSVNDSPVATARSISTTKNTAYVSNGSSKPHLSGTDAEGTALSCAKASNPTNGTVTINSNCSYTYTPSSNYTGSDSFTFTVSDGVNTSSAATVSITVAIQLIDQDNASEGFGSAQKTGVAWNTNSSNKLILAPDTDCDGNMSEGETVYSNCMTLDSGWTPDWSSIVSYWKMDGADTSTTFTDSKGSKATTPAGSAQLSTTNVKVGNASGLFDGNGDYLEVANSGDFNLGNTFAIQAWVRLAALPSAQKAFLSNRANTASAGWFFGVNASNALQFITSDDENLSSSTPLIAGKWHHVVATNNGGTLKLYLDGAQVHSGSSTSTNSSINALRIASMQDAALTTFDINANLDEVAIWKGSTLSDDEVQLLYERQVSKYSGILASRVFDFSSATSWSGLLWTSTLPFLKELPGDANQSDSITALDSESSDDYSSLVGSNGLTTDDNLMSSLIGYWRLNGTTGTLTDSESITDAGPNNYHGSAIDGDVTNNLSRQTSRFQQSIKFDGVNDYIELPAGLNTLGSNLSSIHTYSFWIKTRATAAQTIIGSFNSASTTTFLIRLNNVASGVLQIFMRDDSNRTLRAYGGASLNNGEWRHLVIVPKPSSSVRGDIDLWVDGVKQTMNYNLSSALVSGFSNFAYPVTIGAANSATQSQYFNGEIDEVAIWQRELHENEIRQLYRRGANRILLQARSCNDSLCSGESWIGPSNSSSSFFSELNNYANYNYDTNNCSATSLILTGSPGMLFDCFTSSLSNINSQRYFQYRAILESDDAGTSCDYGTGATWCSPELKSVEPKP